MKKFLLLFLQCSLATIFSYKENDVLSLEESEVFEGAHQLWRSFQQGIKNYIQSNNSGLGVNNVIVPVPISIHPNWQVIRGVFNGTVSTTVLGCE